MDTILLGYQDDAWTYEVITLIENGMYGEASGLIGEALDRDPKDPTSLAMKGYLLNHQGSKKEAKRYFERALQTNPRNDRLRAAILGNLFRPKEALPLIDSYLAEHPDDPMAWGNKAAILSQLGNHVQAVQDFSKMLELKPDAIFARKYKAMLIRTLQEQFNLLICWICSRKFKGKGLEPIHFWSIPTQLCPDCCKRCTTATLTRHATCIESLKQSSNATDGILLAFSFGNLSKFVFEPREKNAVPIIIQKGIVSCQNVMKDPTSGCFLPDPEGKAPEYIQVNYLEDGKEHSLVFNVRDDKNTMFTFMKQVAEQLK